MTQRPKYYFIGRWCRSGAWLVVAMGFFQIIWLFFVEPKLTLGGSGAGSLTSQVLAFEQIFQIVASTIFYFLVLYALGAACDHFFGPTTDQRRPPAPLQKISEGAVRMPP